jgi:hypothetical protein
MRAFRNGQTHRSPSGIARAITGTTGAAPLLGMREVSGSKTPETRHGVE